MRCIAIDDEPLALEVIKDFCSKIDFLHLEGTFTSAIEAVQILNKNTIDLVFIDIQMPNITGLEFVRSLKNPPMVIFTTAYTQHALEGYELNILDYLVKPIPFERFFQAVSKAYELYSLKTESGNRQPQAVQVPYMNNDTKAADYMLVRVEYSTIKVVFADIKYIEGIKDYVKIKVKDKSLLTKATMKNLEEKLPSEKFIRVHKSYIVSIDAIEKIENNRIVMGDMRIPIGSSYKQLFNDFTSRYKL